MTRHRLDLFSLLSGLVLTAIALVALFGVSVDAAPWLGPTILIGVGAVVVGSVLRSQRDGDPAETAAADEEPTGGAASSAD